LSAQLHQNIKFHPLSGALDAKFGGTQSRLNLLIACWVGIGPRAIPVIVDHTHAIASTTITTPLGWEIKACTTIQKLQNLAQTVATSTDNTTVSTIGTNGTMGNVTTSTTVTTTGPMVDENLTDDTITTAATPRARRITRQQPMQANATRPCTTRARPQAATPTACCTTNTTRNAQHCNVKARTTTMSEQKETTSAFIMAPFLCNAIFPKS
jgi:hypothetical protein